MSFTSDLRKQKEEDLTVTLTEMLEDTRKTLKSEIGYELGGDLYQSICVIIDEDIDNKLLKIPLTVKLMLDEASKNADIAFNDQFPGIFKQALS